jgi:hypothetical protein
MKNNEYYNDYSLGYTYLGYAIQPSMMYYAGERLRLKAGLHLLQFAGMETFSEVLPVFSMHVKLSSHLDLIMGGLKGDVHHQLIEPIFNPEHQYTRPIENGLQLVFQNDRLWFDSWLDWEQFIALEENKPEKFTAGFSTKYQLSNAESDWDIQIPAQMVASHIGGQGGNFNEKQHSLANLVGGLQIHRQVGDGFIRKVGLSAYYAHYKDLDNENNWHFHSGSAWYPMLETSYKYGNLMLGYWQADNFLAPKGSPLFQSVSDYKDGYYQKERQLVTAKLSYSRTFVKQIRFSVMLESYYDVPASQFDYSYSMHLFFTPNFKVTTLKFQ